jgi:cytidyltransferase-like protein
MKSRLGIYAGSFNPFHIGHLDIVHQANKIFDDVILAIGKNPDKATVPIGRDGIPFGIGVSSIHHYEGLLSTELQDWEVNGYDVTLIRGMRSIHDLTEEQNLATFVRSMYPSLKVVYFLCKPEFAHISSSTIRGIRKFSEEEYQKYIPKQS